MRAAARWILVALLAGAFPAGTRAAGPLRLPGPEEPPPVVAAIPEWDRAALVALDARGARAAVAFAAEGARNRSRVVLLRDGWEAPWSVEVRAGILDFEFDPVRERLYALAARYGRRGLRDVVLWVFDLEARRASRALSLPLSARGLAVLADGSHLLVAVEDQIRTVLLPELRSGPLVLFGGENLDLAPLPGSRALLVLQPERVALVHLDDPHGEAGLPARASWAAPAAVRQIVASPSGPEALVVLEDGEVYRLRVGRRLRAEPWGRARWVAWTGRPADQGGPLDLPPAPAPEVSVEEARPKLERPGELALPEPHEPEERPPSVPLPPPPPAREEAPARPAPSAAGPSRSPRPAPPPAGPTEPEPSGPAQLEGRLVGAWEGRLEIVFLGPNSVLREAKRVPVSPDGTWRASGLPPGRYRIVVQAEDPDAVVVTAPAFVTLTLEAHGRSRIPDWKVLHVARP